MEKLKGVEMLMVKSRINVTKTLKLDDKKFDVKCNQLLEKFIFY